MKRCEYCILILLVLIGFIAISGSAAEQKMNKSQNLSGSGKMITVMDDRGQYVTVPYPAKRIVFLVENAMNSLYAVGGADNIVGVGDVWKADLKDPFFTAIDPGYPAKPKISSSNGAVDLEALAAAKPDLVVLWSADWSDETTTAINKTLGVPVYGVYYTRFSDISRANDVYGKLTGNEARAQKVSDLMSRYTKNVTDKTASIPTEQRPSVYWMWGDILGTAGLNSATNELIKMAGGRNVLETADFDGKMLEHPTLSLETLQKLNPDIIYMWYNEKVTPEDVMSGKGDFAAWKDLNAVKNKRVYMVDNPFLYDMFTPRQPLALMAIAKDIQPSLFKNIDLEKEADSLFTDIYGVHYPGYQKA